MANRAWHWLLMGMGIVGASLAAAWASDAQEKNSADGPPKAEEWKLVFADEFTKPGLPDPEKWTYEEGYIRNNEKQYYTRARPENVRVEDGKLVIEARKEQFKIEGGVRTKNRKVADYTSGSLTTKSSWTYGKIEVRAKLPTGRGMWPAIWMLGTSGGWPGCGEIDIMENVGFDPDTIHSNMHTQKYNHIKRTNKGAKITIAKPYEDFHVYAVEWHPDRIDSFVDGKKYFTFLNEKTGNDAWPFDKSERLKLNIAIGGDWGGQKGLDNTIFPQRMEIAYVKIFQKKLAEKVSEPAPSAAQPLVHAAGAAAPGKLVIRVACGNDKDCTDRSGVTWSADQKYTKDKKWGYSNGKTAFREGVTIAGTDAPEIYVRERYYLDNYRFDVPSGKYTVRVHMCETWEGAGKPGQRSFGVKIQDKVVQKVDFDLVRDVGFRKPFVREVKDVEVTDGKLIVHFIDNGKHQHPLVNAIEVIGQ